MNYKNVVLAGMLLFSAQVNALEFKQVQAAQSSITFGYKQMGVPMDGKFKQFAAQLSFDQAKLANARASFNIDLASIDTGSSEADEEVAGKLWFNTKAFPSANFVATGIKSLGGNRYEASGKLTIKGITQNVVAPVTFQQSGARGTFEGAFTIRRLDYKIGEGAWSDVGTVANEVQIKFYVVVNAASSK
ncbi:MAG: YceI family protein [Gallionellaceae bacterium]|jgi:polyisoprenoid-binding protein YceI